MKQYIQRYDQYRRSVKESSELGFEGVESTPSNEIPLEDKLRLNSDEEEMLQAEAIDDDAEAELRKQARIKIKNLEGE